MDISLMKMMYKDGPFSPEVQDLPFTEAEKAKVCAFPDHIQQQITKNFWKCYKKLQKPFEWYMSAAQDECRLQGIKPNWEWSKHIATMIPLFGSIKADNKLSPEKKIQVRDKSVRTTAIAAPSYSTDSRQKESLKREGSTAHREWQGFADDHKPKTSLFEAASLSKELQENLRRLGVKI